MWENTGQNNSEYGHFLRSVEEYGRNLEKAFITNTLYVKLYDIFLDEFGKNYQDNHFVRFYVSF